MNLKKIVWIALCTVQICFAQNIAPVDKAPISELEKLFESGRYAEFQASANSLADQGNAEAQFLLGKAYHLGKGVTVDPAQAKRFYDLAASQKNARAEHNLGVMALDLDENPNNALGHFRKAETLGFKMPTFYNLGRTYKAMCDQEQQAALCESAGDAFFQAWQVKPENDWLDEAAASYARACMLERGSNRFGGWQVGETVKVDGVLVAKRQAERCNKAKELTEKGAQLGLARAAFNRGALEININEYALALPWIQLANERELGLAAYQLALMHQDGLGLPKDPAAALTFYKRGVLLKNKQSTDYMLEYWEHEMNASFEPSRISAAMLEWRQLAPNASLPPFVEYRLELVKTMQANRTKFPALAASAYPIDARFCLQKSIGPNYSLDWKLLGVAEPDDTLYASDSLVLIAQGKSDDNMCMMLRAADQKKLRQALAKGLTPMLSWPGQRRLMTVTLEKGALTLAITQKVDYGRLQ